MRGTLRYRVCEDVCPPGGSLGNGYFIDRRLWYAACSLRTSTKFPTDAEDVCIISGLCWIGTFGRSGGGARGQLAGYSVCTTGVVDVV